MNIQRLEHHLRPHNSNIVKFKNCGNIKEISWVERLNRKANIIKISKTQYMHVKTGEVREFLERQKTRADNLHEVSKSLERLRDLINTNVDDVKKCKWITLTYRENMTDTKMLYKDFKYFIDRLRYKVGHFEYIVAMEPQGRGAWHAHMLMIFDRVAPFIENKLMFDIWRSGWVTVKAVDDVDNVGAYLTAYLCDIELNDAFDNGVINSTPTINKTTLQNAEGLKTVDVKNGDEVVSKKIIKGLRMHLYPVGFNLYRSSRGIKKPEIEYMTNFDAEKKVRAATLTFEKTFVLSDDDKNFSSTINKRFFNINR